MDSKLHKLDGEISSCKDIICHIEQSAQFLSDIYDEHKQLKVKMDSIANIIESERSENKYML